jgi:predicted nucleic acid-binding protein
MGGLTLDTSALIALEGKRKGMSEVVRVAADAGVRITVPANAVAEWWRGRTDRRDYVLGMCVVKDVDSEDRQARGRSLGRVRRRRDAKLTIDATVMATAALYGPNLYTGDFDDMARLVDFFPAVRIFGLRLQG